MAPALGVVREGNTAFDSIRSWCVAFVSCGGLCRRAVGTSSKLVANALGLVREGNRALD